MFFVLISFLALFTGSESSDAIQAAKTSLNGTYFELSGYVADPLKVENCEGLNGTATHKQMKEMSERLKSIGFEVKNMEPTVLSAKFEGEKNEKLKFRVTYMTTDYEAELQDDKYVIVKMTDVCKNHINIQELTARSSCHVSIQLFVKLFEMLDPLTDLKNAYFIERDHVMAPRQNLNEILDFRSAYKRPSRIERNYLRFSQFAIRTTKYPEQFFRTPYAFYRVDFREEKDQRVKIICHPFHLETAMGDEYIHLKKVYVDQSSEDLNASNLTTSFQDLLVGDIIGVAELWQLGHKIIAAEYVCLERNIKTSDALIYTRCYDFFEDKDEEINDVFASTVDIPQDCAPASFNGMPAPEFGGSHVIGRCEIFIPIQGVQKFAANFVNDILHPDPLIRKACIQAHRVAQKYRSARQKNYQPLVLYYNSANSFTRNEFTDINEVLRKGNQNQMYTLCSIVSRSLDHHYMLMKSLDVRNHLLLMEDWQIKDHVDFQIRLVFLLKKYASESKRTHIPKKSMMRIYGILPTSLEVSLDHREEKDHHFKIITTLRILDNIPEIEEAESVGRNMFMEVLESLRNEPQLIYGHLIAGEKKAPSFVRKFTNNLPNWIFNELMRNVRNIESPPHFKFNHIPNLNEKNSIKNHLRNLIQLEPTKEQVDTVFFTIFADNPMMVVEAPVGGSKSTMLAANFCIASEHYKLRQMIVTESNGAVLSVCRKLVQFGAKKVLRVTSSVAQKRHGMMLTTEYDLPTVAEREFLKVVMDFEKDPERYRSPTEINILERCYRMLNYMHQTGTQQRFFPRNLGKLRKLVGPSIHSAPRDPNREKWSLVFELVKPDIIIGTSTQIETLLEHHKELDLSVDVITVDKTSVESIFSLYTLISMVFTEKTKKIVLFGDARQFQPRCGNLAIKDEFRSAMVMVGQGLARVEYKNMWRNQPDTARILSKVFYKKETSMFAGCCPILTRVPNLIWPNPNASLRFEFVDGAQPLPEGHELKDEHRFMTNHFEAKEVVRICENLIECGVAKKDIMIISFYSNQVRLLKNMLPTGFTVLTTRSSHGPDAKIVIVSVARTLFWDEDGLPRDRSEEDRPITEQSPFVLMALSRAREKCLVLIDKGYKVRQPWSRIISQSDTNNNYV